MSSTCSHHVETLNDSVEAQSRAFVDTHRKDGPAFRRAGWAMSTKSGLLSNDIAAALGGHSPQSKGSTANGIIDRAVRSAIQEGQVG